VEQWAMVYQGKKLLKVNHLLWIKINWLPDFKYYICGV